METKSLLSYPVSALAKLSTIDNLDELLEKKTTIVIAYAVDEQGVRPDELPQFQAHFGCEHIEGRPAFSLSYAYNDESRGFIFEVDRADKTQVSITGFRGKLANSQQWLYWLSVTQNLRTGATVYLREHMMSGIHVCHLDLGQLILDGAKASINRNAKIVRRGHLTDRYLFVQEWATKKAKENFPENISRNFQQLADALAGARTKDDFRQAANLYNLAADAFYKHRQDDLDQRKQKAAEEMRPSAEEIARLDSRGLVPDETSQGSFIHSVCKMIGKIAEASILNCANALLQNDPRRSPPLLMLQTTNAFRTKSAQHSRA